MFELKLSRFVLTEVISAHIAEVLDLIKAMPLLHSSPALMLFLKTLSYSSQYPISVPTSLTYISVHVVFLLNASLGVCGQHVKSVLQTRSLMQGFPSPNSFLQIVSKGKLSFSTQLIPTSHSQSAEQVSPSFLPLQVPSSQFELKHCRDTSQDLPLFND